jgi:hypothetical protein
MNDEKTRAREKAPTSERPYRARSSALGVAAWSSGAERVTLDVTSAQPPELATCHSVNVPRDDTATGGEFHFEWADPDGVPEPGEVKRFRAAWALWRRGGAVRGDADVSHDELEATGTDDGASSTRSYPRTYPRTYGDPGE